MKRSGIALLLVVLVGCGGNGKSIQAGPTRQALISAVRTYANDLSRGDGAGAYSFLSPKCQRQTNEHAFKTIATMESQHDNGQKINTVTVNSFNPANATVTDAFALGGRARRLPPENQPWVYSGGWRYNACQQDR